LQKIKQPVAMPKLYIECPDTGKEIETGINVNDDTDPQSFRGNQTLCPICDQLHNWDGKTAFLLAEHEEEEVYAIPLHPHVLPA
jgi:hypothetical protein